MWIKITNRKDIPNLPGVYVFYNADEIIYIGSSKSLRMRISNRYKDCKVKIKIMPDNNLAEQLEIKLIKRILPIENKRQKKIFITKIDFVYKDGLLFEINHYNNNSLGIIDWREYFIIDSDQNSFIEEKNEIIELYQNKQIDKYILDKSKTDNISLSKLMFNQ